MARLMNNQVIIHYIERHEQVLHQLINLIDIPASRIKDAILYSLFPGGKRIRPILVYLCGELFDTPLNTLDVIAAAVELIHSFSLIHDDLPAMDNDDFRRGRLSCHRAFDEATAVLVGDGMQAFAVEVLLRELPKHLPAETILTITYELILACGPSGMVSGQSLDMTELTNPGIHESMLAEIHILKTGKLISACIKMVLAASKPSSTDKQVLEEFAASLGLLFQMQDDYLDRYGRPQSLGKGRSSDLANSKQTFANLYDEPSLKALIQHHLEKAHHALSRFQEKANNFHDLLYALENRMSDVEM